MGQSKRPWVRFVAQRERPADMNNTYEATIRIGSSGLQKVTIQASSWDKAKALLEMTYGRDRVMDVHQVS